jgi:hypothetical protein
MNSTEVRARLVDMLRRDLVGPLPEDVCPGDADLQRERLDARNEPSWWYLTGFIAPVGADAQAAADTEGHDEVDADVEGGNAVEGETAGADNGGPAERPAHYRRFMPSSLGLTVMVPANVRTLDVRVTWGDYHAEAEPPLGWEEITDDSRSAAERREVVWQRVPREARVRLEVPPDGERINTDVPDSAVEQVPESGLELVVHARSLTVSDPDRGPIPVRTITIFLVNRRRVVRRVYADVTSAFQARLEAHCAEGLEPRRNLSDYHAEDEDLRLADLHYRGEAEFAVGRNVSAGWAEPDADGVVRRAWTDPLPSAEVERVAPSRIGGVEFGMEALAEAAGQGGAALDEALAELPRQYRAWVEGQRAAKAGLASRRQETADRLVAGMESVCGRIEEGIAVLAQDERARLSFRIMNTAIARALRRRSAGPEGDPAEQKAPGWYPFQLAFILLNLPGLNEKTHPDREVVDLLFFPTGGGKTEAYLGLAAFVIARRRLSATGVLGAGVAVIMRYTLRLLTLDQLGRAAAVICALELIRTDDAFKGDDGRPLLGEWPIEIGLWVGSDSSPNVLGGRGATGDHTAVTRVRRYRKDRRRGAPAPIKGCPWCGTPFEPNSFKCEPNEHAPVNMTVRCMNPACEFTQDRPLPILTVDETIYRRLPAFVIATVDKFASLPWVGETGAFFGHVDRHDANGFYGAARPGDGTPFANGFTLDPPDLVIQDELHLISGPLGTVAGLYEAAVDRLATRWIGDARVRPKIVASTATVRRARDQIRALFDRETTQIFPPPGISREDSWFARTEPASRTPARLYVGLAAQGRGPKLVFLRGLTTMMAAAGALYERSEAEGQGPNPADPYMTAVCYFNALRELGGARRIVEDEVRDRLARYGDERRRLEPAETVFVDRRLKDPLELTSRVSTDDVALAKARLERVIGDADDSVDIALATNMISVGLDIARLGLMLVQGQPKTAAEYIQSTSRVGRDPSRPGLVVTVLNLHKPRDRAHYESFRLFHRTFYRSVEATSVTPWAPRARDRSLAPVVVALARHLRSDLTPEEAVRDFGAVPDDVDQVVRTLLARAESEEVPGGLAALESEVRAVLEKWRTAAAEMGPRAHYTERGSGAKPLLHVPLDPALETPEPPELEAFVAPRSMRDVEASVTLRLRDPRGRVIREDRR